MTEKLIEVINLVKHFPQRGAPPVRAVDGLSFDVGKGETFALVGESGCGKTTAAELILRLQPVKDGEVRFQGRSITHATGRNLRDLRKHMQVVFQNPRSSLNPRMRVHEILAEPLQTHGPRRSDMREVSSDLLRMVKLEPQLGNRYPHEISGGQAQRVAIARALALRPDFIVLDEPMSALDVSVQAQVINLLKDLQSELELTYLFISHDLRVVRHLSNRVGIMYLGKIVELGPTEEIFRSPQHPYAQALLSAIPRAHPRLRGDRIILGGDIPSPSAIPTACRFRTRCFAAAQICETEEPEFRKTSPGRWFACHFDLSQQRRVV